ncbi:MAG: hypothetical protein MJY41_04650 [Bacteroidales bacterium]|nr:hypothetical protein [Bacteroidales bacterium]
MATPSSSCGLRIALGIILLAFSLPAGAQRRISADVEVKQVFQGKSLTTTKSVYCANNGRLVVVADKPSRYVLVTNVKGESKFWLPGSNQVVVDNTALASSRDELLSLFLSGRADDLGLGLYGYTLESTSRDGKYLVRTYASGSRDDIPHVKIVYDNYLPVYCSYIDSSGKEVSKTYFSNYVALQRLSFPCRTTQISYTAKGDSTVTRTIYSNIRADQQDPWFDFEVPSDATAVSFEEAARVISGIAK